ncbi:restriction endonuclease subunit S [Gelidibacter mesophilus]|uniref:restriction endonuclease subunit S n=1 Tax=Gelidibacter mesophilus TaxID=169050 RepID=UPI0004153A7E|nr:restriction endonuclease subunit S [Gelidibacter mesophilus]
MVEVENKTQRYDSYKNSGVEWLGEIPEHWEIKPGFTILSESKTKNIGFLEKTVLSLSYGNVVIKPEEKLTGLVPESFETYQIVQPGDIIIRPTDLQNDKTSLRTGLAKDNGIITSAYINLRVSKAYDNNFYHYYLHTIDINKVIYGLGSGLRQNISFDDFKRFPFPLPPLQEQTAIAQFLDDKTTKIDHAVSVKEKQIELLKERKQILIHKAVTRGLDDTVKLKDSGVEWIGEIPEHWEVKKLKELCKAYGRIGFRGYTTSDLVNEGEGAITISPSNIKDEFMTFEKCSYLSWKKYEESPEIQIFNNDVLVVKTGSTFGKIGIVKDLPLKATINPQLLVLKDISISPDYFYSALKTSMIQIQIQKEVIGSTIPTISETKILNFKIALPPQIQIEKTVVYLNNLNEKFKTAISLKQQEIEKLKEYKSSLINSVVTGKVKMC